MTQLYLDFNTFSSTEDPPCTIKVDSLAHAKSILRNYIGSDNIQYAEVYEIVDSIPGHHYPVAYKNELLRNI